MKWSLMIVAETPNESEMEMEKEKKTKKLEITIRTNRVRFVLSRASSGTCTARVSVSFVPIFHPKMDDNNGKTVKRMSRARDTIENFIKRNENVFFFSFHSQLMSIVVVSGGGGGSIDKNGQDTQKKMRTESKPWRNDFCFVLNCFHFDSVLRNVTVRAMVQLVRFHHTRCN